MENRENVVHEYFQLRQQLNKTNLHPNQTTEIHFSIQKKVTGLTFFALVKGKLSGPFLELCYKKWGSYWKPSGYSGFLHFEEFCRKFLNKEIDEKSSREQIDKALVELKSFLATLGIPRE